MALRISLLASLSIHLPRSPSGVARPVLSVCGDMLWMSATVVLRPRELTLCL